MLSQKFKNHISIIALLYCSFILSSHYVVTKNIGKFIEPPIIMFYRFLIAVVPLICYAYFFKKNPLKNIIPGIILGIFLWVIFILITNGVNYTTASNAGFISGTFIVFIPLILYFIFKIKPTCYNILTLFIALLGLYILTGGLHSLNLGDYLILISAGFTALHLSYASKFAKFHNDLIILCLQQFFTVVVLSLLFAFIDGSFQLYVPEGQICSLIFLGLFPTLSVFLIQIIALKYTSEITASLILTMQPLFSVLFAVWLGDESINFSIIIGGFLIVMANIITHILKRTK